MCEERRAEGCSLQFSSLEATRLMPLGYCWFGWSSSYGVYDVVPDRAQVKKWSFDAKIDD
jgi:hypothetical protein